MTKLSDNVIEEIKQQHIAPAPRWHFLLKGYVFWFLFILATLLGSISFSVIYHIVRSQDWDILGHLQGNLLVSVMTMLPYFWAVSLFLFIIIAYYNCKCTRHGYRYRRRWIILGSVILSILFGSILYSMGMGKKVDRMMSRSVPFYDQSKHEMRRAIWFQPEKGLIVGEIINIDSVGNKMIIKDDLGADWHISNKEIQSKNYPAVAKGKIIKIIGKKEGDREFSAREIRRCNDCDDDEEGDDDEEDKNED